MTVEKSTVDNSLDSILLKVGDFGKYQIYVFSMVCLSVVLHSLVHIAFVFTAMDVPYRCEISDCESKNLEFSPAWLPNAVPYSNNNPSRCQMFQPFSNESDFQNNCTSGDFNKQIVKKCSQFVYDGPEWTILHEYNLQCDENLWKLALVGTINNVGQFFGLVISGIISDRYGRRLCLAWGMAFCSICGVIRTFMPTYEWFLVFEFLDAAFGSGTYICGFVLGIELVGPKKRVISGTIISSTYAIGEILVAIAAYCVKSWKLLIYIVYIPSFFTIFYLWIIPESIRWNLSKGRTEEAKETLRKLAKVNKKELTEKELSVFDALPLTEKIDDSTKKDKSLFLKAIKSSTLMLRLFACCFCWITCTFLFYGLTLNSVALSGNAYIDFIMTALIEIPAYFSCNYVVEKFGRKKSLVCTYLMTGIACLLFTFVPSSSRWGSLCVYLIGKFGATASFTILYVLTSEMFPTNLRHSFMGTCSTIGRCGSMLSPQTPLLAHIWQPLPLVMFASMSVCAGFITMTFPETLNKKLPDTIHEAENLRKAPKISDSLQVYENKEFEEDFKA